jgi:hypothetical protein
MGAKAKIQWKSLDAGIRDVVRILQEKGVDTVSSTPNELRAYEMAAKTAKQSLSEWIRSTLNAAVEPRV